MIDLPDAPTMIQPHRFHFAWLATLILGSFTATVFELRQINYKTS